MNEIKEFIENRSHCQMSKSIEIREQIAALVTKFAEEKFKPTTFSPVKQ